MCQPVAGSRVPAGTRSGFFFFCFATELYLIRRRLSRPHGGRYSYLAHLRGSKAMTYQTSHLRPIRKMNQQQTDAGFDRLLPMTTSQTMTLGAPDNPMPLATFSLKLIFQ